MNLQQLGEEEAKLRLLLNDNLEMQKFLKVKNFKEKHGIEIGDLIEYRYNDTIKQGVLDKISLTIYSNTLAVKPINNDGTISKKTHYNINVNCVKVLHKNSNPKEVKKEDGYIYIESKINKNYGR